MRFRRDRWCLRPFSHGFRCKPLFGHYGHGHGSGLGRPDLFDNVPCGRLFEYVMLCILLHHGLFNWTLLDCHRLGIFPRHCRRGLFALTRRPPLTIT